MRKLLFDEKNPVNFDNSNVQIEHLLSVCGHDEYPFLAKCYGSPTNRYTNNNATK